LVKNIIAGISIKINSIFGDKYRIYTEEVKQNLKEPCFLIRCVASSVLPLMGNRKKQNNRFCITYIDNKDDTLSENIYNVQSLLFANMSFIETADREKYYGINQNAEIIDGILRFFIDYNCIIVINDNKNIIYMNSEEVQFK